MLSIIRLRLQKLKGDYYVFLIMTVLSLAFTFIFSAAYNGDYTPTVLVVDMDKSNYSQMVIDELMENKIYRYSLTTYEDASEKVKKENALAALVINEEFGKSIANNETPILGIIKTKNSPDEMILESIAMSITGKMISNVKMAQTTAEYFSLLAKTNAHESFNKAYNNALNAWKYKKPVNIIFDTLEVNDDSGYDNILHSIIGFSLYFSMYTIVFAVGEILNDRKHRTWQRTLVSPISKTSMLGGNLIVSFLVGVVQILILFGASQFLFGIDYGSNLVALTIVLAVYVFTITSLGLLLSGLVRTPSQLGALSPVILTSTGMLGGCMWPLDIVDSKFILGLGNITPQKWAIEGVEALAMYNKGFEGIITPTLILLGMGILFFVVGVKLVKYE